MDFLTSRTCLDDPLGELHATGRTLDGKRYQVAAAFPRVGLESFAFSQPVAARLTGPDGTRDFEDPTPASGPMRLPGY